MTEKPPKDSNFADYTPARGASFRRVARGVDLTYDRSLAGEMRIRRKIVAMCWAGWTVTLLAFQARPAPHMLAVGQVLEQVACEADPTQTYALYLPSGYTAEKRWPIVYAFDPLARGAVPVRLYKDVAEKYGFVLAGSNNSRNFSLANSVKSANAVWRDTRTRLSLDTRRTYTTGFSGGARIAGLIAVRCSQCQIAGVIAHGAGYPDGLKSPEEGRTLYFLAVGDQDFNWAEVITVREQREDLGMPYRVRVFPGGHQWAPPAIMDDALRWMTLKAMQSGSTPPDAAFIEQFFQGTVKEAEEAERGHDAIGQLSAYRSLVSDFHGLKNVAEYETKLAVLKSSASLKAALKNEQGQIAEQKRLQDEISPQLSDVADADVDGQVKLRNAISQGMARLKDGAEHSKSDEKRLIFSRALKGLSMQGVEAGQSAFEEKHFERAEIYFQLMSECSDDPWPSLLLAETRLAMGNKKQAIRDIREVVRRGLKNPDVLEKDSRLQSLNSDPEFQKILTELRAKRTTWSR